MIVGICGAGTMGRGIAIATLQAGHSVVLYDLHQHTVDDAIGSVRDALAKAVAKGKLDADVAQRASAQLQGCTALEGLAHCNLVVEAIVERTDVKHALFTQLEAIVEPTAILATNTSSISIAALASPLQHRDRFVGLHFFNPAHIMKLVEIIRGPETSQATVDLCLTFSRELGKTPAVAKDVPGFIVNRVARNYYLESQRLVMEGAAEVAQVDALMKGIGFRMGPFELMDLIGVDTNLDVSKSQWQQFFLEPRFAPALLQQQVVDSGATGKKSGRGFYTYSDSDSDSTPTPTPTPTSK